MFPLFSFAIGGVIFVSCWQVIDLIWHRYRGVLTMGRVIRLDVERTKRRGRVYRPVIEYEMEGSTCRLEPLVAMYPALYSQGQEVPVYYFPGQLGSGRLVTPREFFKWGVVIVSLVVVLAWMQNAAPGPSAALPSSGPWKSNHPAVVRRSGDPQLPMPTPPLAATKAAKPECSDRRLG